MTGLAWLAAGFFSAIAGMLTGFFIGAIVLGRRDAIMLSELERME